MFKTVQVIAYGAVPLIGILFFGWDWRQIIIFYWLENIAVGIAAIINIVSLPKSALVLLPGQKPQQIFINGQQLPIDAKAASYAMAGFFALHYGGFTFIHGIFVFVLASGGFSSGQETTEGLPDIGTLVLTWLGFTVVQIMLLWKSRYDTSVQHPSLTKAFTNPYKRIIALHLGIILGAFAINSFNLPAAAAIVLIVMHVLMDFVSFRSPSIRAPEMTI